MAPAVPLEEHIAPSVLLEDRALLLEDRFARGWREKKKQVLLVPLV